MDEEAALLRAICEHPDEDTPRLVFADWLQEQGGRVNTAWAHGIRAQVRLARRVENALNPWTRLFTSPTGVAQVLERLRLPVGLGVGGWERGFPSTVEDTIKALQPVWPQLAFRLPIRKLTLTKPTLSAVRKFVTWSGLEAVPELVLGFAGRSARPADLLTALAGCAGLCRLGVLNVGYVHLTDEALTAVLDSPHLVRLTSFRFSRPYNDPPLSQEVTERFFRRFGYPLA